MSTAGALAVETPNLLHVQFKNPEYLSYLTHLAAPSHASSSPLTEHNIMSYFATSPFFDRRSNNEQIRMQNIANGLATGPSARQEEEELRRFTGLEFVLVHAKGGCFVVQKRWRTGPGEVTPLASYYVVNESIYQAPDLYSVLATRLQSTVFGLKSSLTTQRRARPSFDPRRGHHGRFIVPDPPSASSNDTDAKAATDNDEDDEEAAAEDDEMEFEEVDAAPTSAPPADAPQVKRARFD